jgi:hypothetical protein
MLFVPSNNQLPWLYFYQRQHGTRYSAFNSINQYAYSIKKPALQRLLGLFSYYECWIPRFSEKIQLLLHGSEFPLNQDSVSCIQQIK